MDDAKSAPPPYSSHAGQSPPMMVPGPTVTVVSGVVTTVEPMGSKPQTITCRSCRAQVVTNVRTKATTKTHLIALILCCFLCWPCACVPYCTDSCMNIDHYCPNCDSYLGSYAG